MKEQPSFREEKWEGGKRPEKTSRRKFLELFLGTGAALAGLEIGNLINEAFEEGQEEGGVESAEEAEQEVISRLVDYDADRIELNLETAKLLKEQWRSAYLENSGLNRELRRAFSQIGEWDVHLKTSFKEEDVPEQFRYLAIPESHWKFYEVSSAGAKGPYQFMETTAKEYGLRVDSVVDERLDPLLSASACAKNLKDIYGAMGDWDLALSAYNGSYAWRYLERAENEKKASSYGDFLSFLGERINGIRDKINESDNFSHRIKEGQTLSQLSKFYGVSVKDIQKANSLKSDVIQADSILAIPLENKELKKKLFYKLTSGMNENLNYAPKFHAIAELIEEGKVENQNSTAQFREIVNDEISGDRSLSDIAKELEVDSDTLQDLNPAVRNIESPLPSGYKVRAPKKSELTQAE